MDVKTIDEIIKLVGASDMDEVIIEEGDKKLTLRKGLGAVASAPVVASAPSAASAPAAAPPKSDDADEGAGSGSASDPSLKTVDSPMVGVFYAAPSPEAGNFVEVGSKFKAGDTLCIVEAMKLMNEVAAKEDGVVKEICVENAALVEYGMPLFRYDSL